MKNKIIYLLVAIITALSIWLYFEVQQTYDVVITEDSTRITFVDSIPPPDTVYTEHLSISDPDTVYMDSTIEKDNTYSYFRDYTTTYTDTLVDATVETTVQGFLVTQQFSYTPKYPMQINTTIRNRVTREIIRIPKPKPYVSVGLDVGGNRNGFTLAEPSIWYHKPNGNAFGVGYDITHRAPTLGIRYNLKNIFR